MAWGIADGDPLGKLAAKYQAGGRALLNLFVGITLVVAGVLLAILRVRVAEALSDNPDPALYGWAGGAVAVFGLLPTALGALEWGNTFEVRAKGVRYRRGSRTTEIRWSEVRKMTVYQTKWYVNGAYRGTRWRMHLIGDEDEIRLSESFLSLVPNVSTLADMLELKSGVKFKRMKDDSADEDETDLSADELIQRARGKGSARKRKRRP